MIRRIVAVTCFLGACVAAIVLTGASDENVGKKYKVEFDNAFGLTEGGDLRIGGVKAGRTTAFLLSTEDQDPSNDEPVKAIAEIEITEPGFDSLRADAFCEVRQQSLIGEYLVDCQPGSEDELLPENSTVPVEQTASIIPADLVNNVLRRPYRERLRLIIAELGTGLAGRPQDLAATIQRAHPGLRETTETLEILGEQKEILQNFVTDSDRVVEELAQNKVDVARFVSEAGETAEISASRREQLAEQFRRLPTFLGELEPTMVRLGQLADAQVPLLADLRTAAPDLERFFAELGPFAQATRPSLRTLGDAGDVGRRAINESANEIRELRRLARSAPGLGKPLRQLLVSLDDRGRAVERDARAGETAPPPPDPTARRPNRGFTGFEAFANYAFWQTLAINGFDDVSHFLRIVGIENECGEFSVDPSHELLEECNAFLGPYQPGVRNATGELNGRNFNGAEGGNFSTAGGGSSSSSSSSASSSQKDGGAQAAQADALPPGLSDLLGGQSSANGGPNAQGKGDVPPDQLLDFLLGP